MSLYAGMMRAGIPMREADETDLEMYLKVLAQAAKHDKDDKRQRGPKTENTPRGKKRVVELQRGYIDDFWG